MTAAVWGFWGFSQAVVLQDVRLRISFRNILQLRAPNLKFRSMVGMAEKPFLGLVFLDERSQV